MMWIWQRADWPIFTWDRSRLVPLEARFLYESGRLDVEIDDQYAAAAKGGRDGRIDESHRAADAAFE